MSADRLDALPPVATVAAQFADVDALLAAGEPVRITDAFPTWPALAAGRSSPAMLDGYLRRHDRGALVPMTEAPPSSGGKFGYTADLREFSFSKRTRPLVETLDRIARAAADPAAGTIAIQLLPLDTDMPGFVADNPMPLVPGSARPRLWLGGPVRTQIHNDRDHNLACVIAGHRRFTLFPPEQVGNLYIGPLENPPPLSLVDPEAPDLVRFPRFAEALSTARIAELGPGDALLMPRYWWHHVTSRDRYNAMVNYWWGSSIGVGEPQDAFLTALLALKPLPPRERAYWQAMFAAHVFADEGAAHLPAARRGVLGTLTPPLRNALRQRLRNAALKT
ncbi:MAG: cupin-like domain-containing protein [Sphingomonas sp.]